MHGRWPVAALLVLLAGCTGAGPAPATPLTEEPAEEPWGFLDPVLALADCEPLFDLACFEPVTTVGLDGAIFLSTVDGRAIAFSPDGLAFSTRPAPPMPVGAPPLTRRGDGTVQVAQDGRLFYSALLSSPTAADLGAAYLFGTQVASSNDNGQSWQTNVYVATAGGDRQWLAFGPADRVYLSFWQIPTGLWVARSDDGGATFQTLSPSSPSGAGGVPGPSGPPAVLASGRLLVPHSRSDGVHMALSDDGGLRFTDVLVSTQRAVDWPSLAAGADGCLAIAWPQESGDVLVATSPDDGATWSAPTTWGSDFQRGAAAWLACAGQRLALAWFAEPGELRFASGEIGGVPDRLATIATGLGATPPSDFAHVAVGTDGRSVVSYAQGDRAYVRIERNGTANAPSSL